MERKASLATSFLNTSCASVLALELSLLGLVPPLSALAQYLHRRFTLTSREDAFCTGSSAAQQSPATRSMAKHWADSSSPGKASLFGQLGVWMLAGGHT